MGGKKNDIAGRIADHAESNLDGYGELSSDHGSIGALLPAKPACYTAAMEAAAEEGGDVGAAGAPASIIAEPEGMDEDEQQQLGRGLFQDPAL